MGFFAIAQGLTRDGIPCPSAHDRKRNSHRTGVAWSKSAVRAILLNPRYTGREVWNKQRKDEVLIDVEDVALGHETKMRWNDKDTWIWSAKPTHPAIVTPQVQALAAAGSRRPNVRKTRTMQRHYLFSGRVRCGLCGRLMQGNFNNGRNHYRCRYPADYAAANHVEHPKAVYLREDVLAGPVDEWLTQAFAPAKLTKTLTAMSEAEDSTDDTALAAAKEAIQSCGQRLQRYRAALEAGTDPSLIQQWTAEVQAERVQAEAKIRELTGRQRMTTEEIKALVNALRRYSASLDRRRPDRPGTGLPESQSGFDLPPGPANCHGRSQARRPCACGLCPRTEPNFKHTVHSDLHRFDARPVGTRRTPDVRAATNRGCWRLPTNLLCAPLSVSELAATATCPGGWPRRGATRSH
ncbi:recombinase family protein [Cryptosporangium sp. NPDC048952]|uniref:recombinase family protein n=1 Tax=Cryptosporangium sp. NPDC048952 TaxID=3363961 RepID=UPI00370FB89C